ncbi:membrane dipeptidase [Anaerosalibacter massiliensis]|uniref:Membrane dipeptidase n=1 Tax=Anaerosalibacter massiliensis TaxID=1347392 RepID=A0A9X2S6P1_9FIRM|nr:membrane dipeptidase [Anaerosalibacter massiliensis]MCR2045584.1 membrane dipeptidase [Anaerosalibacter massiliensis]
MIIFNGHSDILTDINLRRLNGERDVFRKYHYENFLKSNVKSAIWVIWVDPEHSQNPKNRTSQIINSMKEEFDEAADIINVVKRYGDFKKGFEEDKINILIGMEGLTTIEDNVNLIETYYNDIGLRHASLTWNKRNMLASGVGDDTNGVTSLGIKAIEKIEELGILLDVSHLNEKSFWDIVSIVSGPIIASHSNARYFANVKRNLNDEQLLAIANSGGLVGVNSVSVFVNDDRNKQKIDDLIDQIDYIKRLIGIEHIGFGFDFCDFLPPSYVGEPDPITNSITVKGLSSEADIKNLINRMRERGYREEEIELIAYKNYDNLLEKVLK